MGLKLPLNVVSAGGCSLKLSDGRTILDCISGDGLTHFGYGSDLESAAEIRTSSTETEVFVSSEALKTDILELLPTRLNRLVFTGSNQDAVVLSIKAAFAYWKALKEPRDTIICFGENKEEYEILMAQLNEASEEGKEYYVVVLPFPDTWMGDRHRAKKENEVIDRLEIMLDADPEKYAAILMEPLVKMSSMQICSEEFMQKIQWSHRQFDTLLIFDETRTGFGRTGHKFGFQTAQVEPDILCIGNALSGSGEGPTAVAMNQAVYDEFSQSECFKSGIFQQNTISETTLKGSLTALKQLQHFEPSFNGMEALHLKYVELLKNNDRFEKVRIKGSIAAFDYTTETELKTLAGKFYPYLILKDKFLLKILGRTLYLMPPYSITEPDLASVYEALSTI